MLVSAALTWNQVSSLSSSMTTQTHRVSEVDLLGCWSSALLDNEWYRAVLVSLADEYKPWCKL